MTVTVSWQRLHDDLMATQIGFDAPRANSLEPALLDDLVNALDVAEAAETPIVRLSAAGRNFSSGGDLGRFIAASDAGDLEDYAHKVVGALQALIVRMLDFPAVIVTAARGAVTGGSAGLLFASDVVLLADDAFIQPYFAEVGFSPDGGWTALLPDLVGPRRALAWQYANRRLTADEAVAEGLAVAVAPSDTLEAAHDDLIASYATRDLDAMIAAKQLVWDSPRLDVIHRRLVAEEAAFCRNVTRPAVDAGMRRFVANIKATR